MGDIFMEKNKYQGFSTAIYCPVYSFYLLDDINKFDREFDSLLNKVHIDKVYIETHRSGYLIDKVKILNIKKYFEDKGLKTSGGITTTTKRLNGFGTFCYTNKGDREKLKKIVVETASIFDEIILDDFFFNNCKCQSCFNAKGEKTFSQFRQELMREVSENLILKPAKEINPNCKVIIKFPNWYEDYENLGYNLKQERGIFDFIYTGTETRSSDYTEQHLPKYSGYFLTRYLDNVAPERNMGGWFDPFNSELSDYATQAEFTLLAKAKEVTLYSLADLLRPEYSYFAPIVGQSFENLNKIYDNISTPTGTATYVPLGSSGENYLHGYFGMLGVPLEPYPSYPFNRKNIFLTKSAAADDNILEKIMQSLRNGGNITITSGLLEIIQKGEFEKIANIKVTNKRIHTNDFSISDNHGIEQKGSFISREFITLPIIEAFTNDTWKLANANGKENNIPLVLTTDILNGRLNIIAVPDDFGELYFLPKEVLKIIRKTINSDSIDIEAESKIVFFTYDNGYMAIKSFNKFSTDITITVDKSGAKFENLLNNEIFLGVQSDKKTVFKMSIMPQVCYFIKLI